MTTPGWTAALENADLEVNLAKDVPLLFRRLPVDGDEDEFCMGAIGESSNEEPRHRVRITKPFYISIFPVTQQQWRCVAQETAAELNPSPSDFEGDLRPVDSVDWNDAVQWCAGLLGLRSVPS